MNEQFKILWDFPSPINIQTKIQNKNILPHVITRLLGDTEWSDNIAVIRNHNMLSCLYVMHQDYDKATEQCEKALSIDSKSIIAIKNKAWILHEQQRNIREIKTACEQLKILTQKQELMVTARAEIAYAYSRLGVRNIEEAISLFKKSLTETKDIVPRDEVVWNNAKCLWMFGIAFLEHRTLNFNVISTNGADRNDFSRQKHKEVTQLFFDILNHEGRSSTIKICKARALVLIAKLVNGAKRNSFLFPNKEIDILPIGDKLASGKVKQYVDKALELCPNDGFVLDRCGQLCRYLRRLDDAVGHHKLAIQVKETSFSHHHLALSLKTKLEIKCGHHSRKKGQYRPSNSDKRDFNGFSTHSYTSEYERNANFRGWHDHQQQFNVRGWHDHQQQFNVRGLHDHQQQPNVRGWHDHQQQSNVRGWRGHRQQFNVRGWHGHQQQFNVRGWHDHQQQFNVRGWHDHQQQSNVRGWHGHQRQAHFSDTPVYKGNTTRTRRGGHDIHVNRCSSVRRELYPGTETQNYEDQRKCHSSSGSTGGLGGSNKANHASEDQARKHKSFGIDELVNQTKHLNLSEGSSNSQTFVQDKNRVDTQANNRNNDLPNQRRSESMFASPSQTNSLVNLIKCHRELRAIPQDKHTEETQVILDHLQRAYELGPNALAFYEKGLTLRQLGRTDEAFMVFLNIIQNKGTNRCSVVTLANSYEQAAYCRIDLIEQCSDPDDQNDMEMDCKHYLTQALELQCHIVAKVPLLKNCWESSVTLKDLIERKGERKDQLRELTFLYEKIESFGDAIFVLNELKEMSVAVDEDYVATLHKLIEIYMKAERYDDASITVNLLRCLPNYGNKLNPQLYISVHIESALEAVRKGELNIARLKMNIAIKFHAQQTREDFENNNDDDETELDNQYDIFLLCEERVEDELTPLINILNELGISVTINSRDVAPGKLDLSGTCELIESSRHFIAVIDTEDEPSKRFGLKVSSILDLIDRRRHGGLLVVKAAEHIAVPAILKGLPDVCICTDKMKSENKWDNEYVCTMVKSLLKTLLG